MKGTHRRCGRQSTGSPNQHQKDPDRAMSCKPHAGAAINSDCHGCGLLALPPSPPPPTLALALALALARALSLSLSLSRSRCRSPPCIGDVGGLDSLIRAAYSLHHHRSRIFRSCCPCFAMRQCALTVPCATMSSALAISILSAMTSGPH